eukprot:gene633-1225_t
MDQSRAYVSMLVNDNFFPGLSVLSKTLKRTGTSIPFYVMVTENVTKATLRRVAELCNEIVHVESITNPNEARDASWTVSELTKLNIWRLTQFEKIVYIDADAIVMETIDELFDRECEFAASPDIFPPDRFNAGVLFVKPNEDTFHKMMSLTSTLHSYDGGDTGFLNAFFNDWYKSEVDARLPFGYNAQRTLYWFTHEKNPDCWKSIKPLKIIHYSSSPKPWEVSRTSKSLGDLEWLWWNNFLDLPI